MLHFRRHVALSSQGDSGVVYVGLGDGFDDDRRLVRELAQSTGRSGRWRRRRSPAHDTGAATKPASYGDLKR